jgi:hypothetical protein
MDEISEFKKFLGPIAKDYNDAQLHQLRREMYAMADLLLDIHLNTKRRTRPRPAFALTVSDEEATIPS